MNNCSSERRISCKQRCFPTRFYLQLPWDVKIQEKERERKRDKKYDVNKEDRAEEQRRREIDIVRRLQRNQTQQ